MSNLLTQSHGRTNLWRMGQPYRHVLVRSVTGAMAHVKDVASGSETDMPSLTPDGRRPIPGDLWLASVESGIWSFDRLVDPARRLITSIEERLGQVENTGALWSPYDHPTNASPEIAHGAYLGERRYFEVPPNDRWVKLNGQAISRHRYRDYFDLVGTRYGVGDGISTFNVAVQDDPGGRLGLSTVTTSTSAFISATDLTSMTFTTPIARKVLLYGETYFQGTVAGDTGYIAINSGAGAQYQSSVVYLGTTATFFKVACSVDVVSAAGVNTFKLTAGRNTGSGTITCMAAAGYPTILRAIDLGVNTPAAEGWYVCVE